MGFTAIGPPDFGALVNMKVGIGNITAAMGVLMIGKKCGSRASGFL
jgi:hypothetical protein